MEVEKVKFDFKEWLDNFKFFATNSHIESMEWLEVYKRLKELGCKAVFVTDCYSIREEDDFIYRADSPRGKGVSIDDYDGADTLLVELPDVISPQLIVAIWELQSSTIDVKDRILELWWD